MTVKNYDKMPPWAQWIIREATDGVPEEPNHDNRGPVIRRYIALGKCGQEGDPYCAIGVNAGLESSGIPGTRSPLARSFENHPNFVKLTGPALGAITTFWRKSRSSGLGHVGVYAGETRSRDHVYVWGFNQHDDANLSPFPREGVSFGLSGYWWPRSYPAPLIQSVLLDGGGRPINTKVT